MDCLTILSIYIDIRYVLLERGRGGSNWPPPPHPLTPQKKLPSKSPALLGLMSPSNSKFNFSIFFIQVLRHYSVSWKITNQYFFRFDLFPLDKKSPLKWNFWTLSGWVKIHQIPHVIFETKSQLFFKLCITLKCHER